MVSAARYKKLIVIHLSVQIYFEPRRARLYLSHVGGDSEGPAPEISHSTVSNTAFSLVNNSHVTSILASDWSILLLLSYDWSILQMMSSHWSGGRETAAGLHERQLQPPGQDHLVQVYKGRNIESTSECSGTRGAARSGAGRPQ